MSWVSGRSRDLSMLRLASAGGSGNRTYLQGRECRLNGHMPGAVPPCCCDIGILSASAKDANICWMSYDFTLCPKPKKKKG